MPPTHDQLPKNLYETLCAANRQIIQNKTLSDAEKQHAAALFLSHIDNAWVVEKFHRSVCASSDGRGMYPSFYITPYNKGKKIRLITGELPKTHILSANHYELEILRLLLMWLPENPLVEGMRVKTLERLETTCFAQFCGKGECVGAGVSAIRFLSVALSPGDARVDKLLQPLAALFLSPDGRTVENKNLPIYYFVLALTGLDDDHSEPIIRQKKDYLAGLLFKPWKTGPAERDTYNPLVKHVLKNALCRLPEYAHLRDAGVYISEQDNRCYCG